VFSTICLIGGVLIGLGIGALVARIQVRRALLRAEMAQRRARAAERLAEVGAMTGGLAHEIKNPLSTIGLNAQLLSEGVQSLPTDRPAGSDEKERLARRASALRREVERLRGILTDFLTYAGELRLDQKPTNLNEIVSDLAEFFLPQAQGRGVRLRLELAPQPLIGMLDAALIKQAVLNLMLNAVQAMEGASRVDGSPRELILRTVGIHGPAAAGEGGHAIQLHVIDTGPGIPPEMRERLFTPYFTTKPGGSGLGLPTTRRIVEAHQGRIEVHTEVGKGTDFIVTFPAVREQAGQATPVRQGENPIPA
jgi:signal transduction histidine kinase